MAVRNLRLRRPAGVGALTSGVTLAGAGSTPVRALATEKLHVIRHEVELPGNVFTVTAAGGGAADAQGQKLLTLPEGAWIVLGSKVALSTTTGDGVSVASAVWSLGTAAATADNGALTGTEADVLSSQTLGDGTLAAAATETDSLLSLGTGAAVGLVDATSAEKDVYLNIGGTFTHASETAVEMTVSGTVELYLVDLGA